MTGEVKFSKIPGATGDVCPDCGAPTLKTRSGDQVVCSRCEWHAPVPGAAKPAKASKPAPVPAAAPKAKNAATATPATPALVRDGDAMVANLEAAAHGHVPVASKTKSKKGKWTTDLVTEIRRMGRRIRFYADTFTLNGHPRRGEIAKLLEAAASSVDATIAQVAHWDAKHDGAWPEPRPWSTPKPDAAPKAPKAPKPPKAEKPAKHKKGTPSVPAVSAPAAPPADNPRTPGVFAVGDRVRVKGAVPKGVAAIATKAELDSLVVRNVDKKSIGVQAGDAGLRFVIEAARLEAAP